MPDIDPKIKQSDMACCVLNLKMETRYCVRQSSQHACAGNAFMYGVFVTVFLSLFIDTTNLRREQGSEIVLIPWNAVTRNTIFLLMGEKAEQLNQWDLSSSEGHVT